MADFFTELGAPCRETPFLPAGKPIFVRDADGRLLKITRLCELSEDTVLFTADIVRDKEAANG
jgi:hypothetical protein